MSSGEIVTYTGELWPEIERLIAQYPHKPMRHFGRWTDEALGRLLACRVKCSLEAAGEGAWVMRDADGINTVCSVTSLAWDTEQIGVSAGRIDWLLGNGPYTAQLDHSTRLARRALEYLADIGVTHVSARTDAHDISTLHSLEETGFRMVDGLITFAIELDKADLSLVETDVNVRMATEADADAAGDIAYCTYSIDRFHSDGTIPKDKCDDLHRVWVRNSVLGNAADGVVVAEDENGLLGYVTCKISHDTNDVLGDLVGTVVLVGVSRNARGKGVGRAMSVGAMKWFREQGCAVADVGTQLANIPASRLYESCGYRIAASSVSLRCLL